MHRLDEPALAALLELSTQVPDIHAQRVTGRAEVVAPYAVVDQLRGQHAAGVEHQQLQQLELSPGQVDLALADPHRMGVRI